jgi:DNA-binding Lrp family transcriptional regulator
MITAYVAMNSELGFEDEVIENIKEIPEVTEHYSLYGIYDILTKIEANNREELSRLITTKIRRIEHIKNTITFVIIDQE